MALLFLPQTLESIDVHCFGHLLYEMTYGRPPDSVPVDSFPPAPSMAVGQYRAWEWGLLGPGSLQSFLTSFQSPRKIQRKLSSSLDRAHISKYSDNLSVCPAVSSLWHGSSKLDYNSGSNRVERELWPSWDLIRRKVRVKQLEVRLEELGTCQSPVQTGMGPGWNLRAVAGDLESKGLASPSEPPDSKVSGVKEPIQPYPRRLMRPKDR